MKKITALILLVAVVFSFASCTYIEKIKGSEKIDAPKNETEGSAASVGGSELIGMWYVESTQINATDKPKSMLFELMNNMYFFRGAQVEFRTDGTTSMNGMIADYKVPRANVIETTNAQGEVTECTYEVSGNKLTMNFYSDEYIVVLSKEPIAKESAPQKAVPKSIA